MMTIKELFEKGDRFIKNLMLDYEVSNLDKILEEILKDVKVSWFLVDYFSLKRVLVNWVIFSPTLVKYILDKRFRNLFNKGKEVEFLGCKYLSNIGLEIVLTNYRTRNGEIDIVGFDGRSFRFIEVKSSFSFVKPEENITYLKVNKILLVSDDFISEVACQEVGYDALLFDKGKFTYVRDYLR